MPPCSPTRKLERAGRGFTLIELLLSMTAAAFMLTVLLECFSSSINAWVGEEKREQSQREVRSAMRTLGDDLSTMVAIPLDSNAALNVSRTRFWLQAPADDYTSSSIAFLHTSRAQRKSDYSGTGSSSSDAGDLRLVAYTVALSDDAGGVHTQKLWRKEFSHAETWQRLSEHIFNAQPLISADDFKDIPKANSGAEPIAYDVIRFSVQAFQFQAPASGSVPVSQVVSPWPAYNTPAGVDVVLRVTNRITAQKLSTDTDWRGQGNAGGALLGNPATPTNYDDDAEARTAFLRATISSTLPTVSTTAASTTP